MISDDLIRLLTEKSSGILQLGGARMAILDIESGFWGIRRQIKALLGTALTNSVFQQAGANGGASFARSFLSGLGISGLEAFSACLQIYQSAGFGQFEIKNIEWPIGRIHIRADQAFEAWMMGQNDQTVQEPCCAYTAGVLVGFVNIIAERQDVVCIEHCCQGKGDGLCEFELLPAAQARNQAVVAMTPDPGLGRQINLLEMLFERMPMGIAIIDREYRVQRYNPTWVDFSERYAPPSAAMLTPGVCYFDHLPGTESTVIPLFERAFAGETVRRNGVRLESEGIVTYWDVVLAPLVEDDEIDSILNVAVDATERVDAQLNLERRVEERTRELDRRRAIAESLREIIGMINSRMPLNTLLERAVKMASDHLGAGACVLHHFDMDNQVVIHMAGFNTEGIFKSGARRPFSELGSSGGSDYLRATLERQPTYTNYPPLTERIDEIKHDPAIPEAIKDERITLRQRFAGSLSVPLFIQDDVYGGMVFYYTEPQDFSDEQIQLGLSFAERVMVAIENARLHQAEQERQRELHILLDIAETANSSLDLDEVLTKTLDLVVEMLGASRAGVIMVNEHTGELAPYMLRPERAIESSEMAKMVQACESVIASSEVLYIAPDEALGLLEPGALLPLQTRGCSLGVLGIIGAQGSTFSESQLVLFKSIADQMGIAIENAQLFEKAEEAAITTERNRLARDLHDAVTQTLFSSGLIAEVLPRLWQRNPEEAQRRLEELRQLTKGALSEMRTLLLELRPAALADIGLGDLIGHQVNAFTARARLPVEFNQNCKENPPFDVKEMFYRITQEALNNIAKHADATTVTVWLDCHPGTVELIIQDDGVGFDLEAAKTEGLGLGIMQERAQNVGAQLEIHSQIDDGTKLRIFWQETNMENMDE
jgi:signal transduction histidine kinase/predicted hydrocarbon binding protein